MKEISTETEINAPADRVWQVFTDFPRYPEWNPFMRSFEGELKVGAQVKVNLLGMTIKPRLLKVEPNRELRWLDHLIIPGLFDGEHFFQIEPTSDGRVRFVQGERFTGVLIPVLSAIGLFRRTLRGFNEMNQALKAQAEQDSD